MNSEPLIHELGHGHEVHELEGIHVGLNELLRHHGSLFFHLRLSIVMRHHTLVEFLEAILGQAVEGFWVFLGGFSCLLVGEKSISSI